MIIKIMDSGNAAGGFVKYMAGPGKHNEHTDQHMVMGGSVYYGGTLDDALREQVTADLMAYQKLNPDVKVTGGSTWHASLSLSADEGQLSDAKWGQIAQEFMQKMEFIPAGKADVRWGIFRHGLSEGGNDHVHILMNRIRADGTKVSTYRDMVKGQRVVSELEVKHGLNQIVGRGQEVGSVPFTPKESERAKATGNEVERVEIERIVRGTAAASATEAEFVRRLRGAGMEVRPRVSGDVITGYSVGMPGTNVHFAGGKIARDLTLPRLRLRWAEKPAGTEAAALEWIHGAQGKPLVSTGRETRQIPVTDSAVTKELQALKEAIPGATTLELREIGQDLSGALALGSRVDPSLAKPARDAGRWAQTRSYNHRPPHRLMNVGLLILQASDPLSPMGTAIMLKQVLSTLRTIHEYHQAQCQVAFGKGNPMTHPAPDDGISELGEGIAVVGVTIGAQAVQRALAKRQQEQPVGVAVEKEAQKVPVGAGAYAGQFGTAAPIAPSWDTQQQELAMAASASKQKSWEEDAMTPRQRLALESYARNAGLDAKTDLEGFASWTKGDASAAIGEFQKHARTPAKLTPLLTPDAQGRWDPTKIKPRTTAVRPGAGPIQGEDIRQQRGRGGR